MTGVKRKTRKTKRFAVSIGSHILSPRNEMILEFHVRLSSEGESIIGSRRDFSVEGGHGMMDGEDIIVGITELGLLGDKNRAKPPVKGRSQMAFLLNECRGTGV